MRGPRGKGIAEMAVARVASCGFETPMSDSYDFRESFEVSINYCVMYIIVFSIIFLENALAFQLRAVLSIRFRIFLWFFDKQNVILFFRLYFYNEYGLINSIQGFCESATNVGY